MDSPQIIYKYFLSLSDTQKKQIEQLGELYACWNSKINIISRKDIGNFYERHVLHSLGIAKIISFKPKTKILDVGTGGGFPGIPLAILFPECEFHLVDSIGKKIKVVKAVAEALNLKNTRAEQLRLTASPILSPSPTLPPSDSDNKKRRNEETGKQSVVNFDFVISRAVTELLEFYKWTKDKFLSENFNDLKNGILYLKGGDIEEESQKFMLKKVQHPVKNQIFDLKNYFKESFFETKKVIFLQR